MRRKYRQADGSLDVYWHGWLCWECGYETRSTFMTLVAIRRLWHLLSSCATDLARKGPLGRRS